MKRLRLGISAICLVVAACIGSEDAFDTSVDEATQPPPETVSSHDDGQARFMLGTLDTLVARTVPSEMNGEAAARLHMLRYKDELGLSAAEIEQVELQGEHVLPAGAAIYRFTQRIDGLPVFEARASVLMDGSKNLVSLANTLAPSWVIDARSGSFEISAERALARAYVATGGPELLLAAIREANAREDGWHTYSLDTDDALDSTARQVLFRDGDRLVPAYHIELMTRSVATRENQLTAFVIAGDDGRVLLRKSLTAHEAFTYRVYADPVTRVPYDGPLADATPHPTSVPENYQAPFAKPQLVTIDGFNKNKDPWLEAGATYTFGNNVRAYSDRNQGNGGSGFTAGDFRAEVTSPKTFDRTYDLTKAPDVTPDQVKASVTQVFYLTNWMHDYYYDSGFDEASGNGQVSNFGRGGVENDPLLAEAQDSADSGRANNANMSTPADGRSPRMQMYVWTGTPNRSLVTEPPVRLDDWLGAVSFAPTTFSLSATELVLANDGSTTVPAGTTPTAGMTGTVSDACQMPMNVRGKIAVIDRGLCTYVSKVQNAQAAGAVGVLVINNRPGHTSPNVSTTAMGMTIPAMVMSFEDGARLKAALASEGGVRAMKFSREAEIRRDGSIDNTVVAHEWGHYLHMRLQNGRNQQFGGMSEGWGDFNALFMVIRDGDTFAGKAYPISQYAAGGFDSRAGYYGIRRAPYSVDYTINPFTFKHIRADADLPTEAPLSVSGDDAMNEAHAVGEIWAQVMFEVYVAVLEAGQAAGRPFEETKRRMADYVVASLKAAPDDPTIIDQRDAVIAAVKAMVTKDPTRAADVDAVTRAFAKRGLGAGATGPARSSTNLNQVVESFNIATSK